MATFSRSTSDVVGRSFVRLDHHSAVGEEPVTWRIPPVLPRVACDTSPEAAVVPPATTATRGTIGNVFIVILIDRREIHSFVIIAKKLSVAVVVAFILERVSENTPHIISIVVIAIVVVVVKLL